MDISVSNAKDIIDHFLSLNKKYVQGRLVSMVDTGTDAKNIFWRLDHIKITDMYHQAHGYFGLLGIGNLGNKVLSNLLVVSALQNLANNVQ